MRKKQRIFSFIQLFVAVALLTGFDQLTKLLAVKNLKGKADIPLIPDVLYFQYLENRGAAFGIFQDRENLSGSFNQPDFSWRLLCFMENSRR